MGKANGLASIVVAHANTVIGFIGAATDSPTSEAVHILFN